MARLMSSTELHQRLQRGEGDVILIDVKSPEEFEREHIPNAVNIPLDRLEEEARQKLNKNQRIIVYGGDHDDPTSNEAAGLLEELGFRKVSDFDGGSFAWKRAGFRTTGTEADEG